MKDRRQGPSFPALLGHDWTGYCCNITQRGTKNELDAAAVGPPSHSIGVGNTDADTTGSGAPVCSRTKPPPLEAMKPNPAESKKGRPQVSYVSYPFSIELHARGTS